MKNATVEKRNELRSAPMPMMAAFVKLAVGTVITGTLKSATFELEKKKNKKGKMVEKDRYHFVLELAEDTELLVGPKAKTVKKLFAAGSEVTLPEHGILISAMRRTACELGKVPFNVESDTDLRPIEGVYFEITREDDREIPKGEFAGTMSAVYDVKYRAPVAA